MPDRDALREGWPNGWSPPTEGKVLVGNGLANEVEMYPPGIPLVGSTGWVRSWDGGGPQNVRRPPKSWARGWPTRGVDDRPYMRQGLTYWSNSNTSGNLTLNLDLAVQPYGVLFLAYSGDSAANPITGAGQSVTCEGYTFWSVHTLFGVTLADSGQGRQWLVVGIPDPKVREKGQRVTTVCSGAWRSAALLEVPGIRGELVDYTEQSPTGTIGNMQPTAVWSNREDEVFIGARHVHSGGSGPSDGPSDTHYKAWGTADYFREAVAGRGNGLMQTAFARPMEVDGGKCFPVYNYSPARNGEALNSIWR